MPPRPASLKPGLNHVLSYGQSLSSGWEGWPALSTTPVPGAFMLGASVRPRSESDARWEAVGQTALQPLVATVQDLGGALLSPDAVAALAPGDPSLGETVLEGAIAEWRSRGAIAEDHALLASACGVGGRSLEALSKGAAPELFNRLRSCVRLARGVAAAAGRDYGLAALLFLQGENNSWGLGGTADRAGYRALLTRFHADFVADIAAEAAGQAVQPAMFMYQTSGAYASADNAVSQAQLDVIDALPLCYLAAPVYPVTDKGGHLDANGYRWLGAQFGKVMHRVLTLGEDWQPLRPLRARLERGLVWVDFHVPAPPLAWGRPFVGLARRDVRDQGFAVHDDDGEVALTEVALGGPTLLRLGLARRPGPGAVLRYAAASHGGVGCLRDSDGSASALRFQWEPGMTPSPGPDIAALVGRPYPLHNWCVAFAIPIEID
jgi:hypothetical protein